MKTSIFFHAFVMLFMSCSTSNRSKEPVKSFAEVNGTKLYYEVHGSGEPIIFVHGNFGDVRHWDSQVEPFSQNYEVVRYDVRGYGRSAVPDTAIAYRDYEDLRALMDYLKIEKANICGWSMGSGIAIDFALAYPDRVISLIPIGPWPGGYGGAKYSSVATDSIFTIFGKVFSLISSEGPKSATDYWWAGDHEIKTTVVKPGTLQSLLTIGYEYSWWAFLHPSKRASYSPPAVELLGTIKTPTLIVTAQHDIQACKEAAKLMHSQIQNSQLVSIENAGHGMHMDNPKEFNRVIVDFMNR